MPRKIRRLLFFLLLSLALFLLGRSPRGGSVYELAVYPFRMLARIVVGGVEGATGALLAGDSRQAETKPLREELLRLGAAQNKIGELEQENQNLRALLGRRSAGQTKSQLCRVIARSPSQWFSVLTIDVGRRNNVEQGHVVLDKNGVIGVVYRARERESEILMITDPDASAGARVERSGDDRGWVKGTGGALLKLSYPDKAADVKPGDKILTSGLGGVYPGGIPIGTVKSVRNLEGFAAKEADVVPAADLRHAVWLLVMPPDQPWVQPSPLIMEKSGKHSVPVSPGGKGG